MENIDNFWLNFIYKVAVFVSYEEHGHGDWKIAELLDSVRGLTELAEPGNQHKDFVDRANECIAEFNEKIKGEHCSSSRSISS